MSKRQNFTTYNIPKEKDFKILSTERKNMVTYIDTDGGYNRLYEATFRSPNDPFLVKMSDDDPRMKLRKQREEDEWEKFKKKNLKIRVNEFKDEEERKRYLESKEPLPINPHIIVLAKDPKRKVVQRRKRKVIRISDLPREGNIYSKDEMEDYFNKQFEEGIVLEKDYINLRLINEINLRHPRKFDQLGKPSKYSILCEDLGYFGLSEDTMYCDMNKFGVGLVDYFRILKLNFLFYLILALMGFLCLYSCGENFLKLNDIQKMFHFSDSKDFLTKFTLGNTLSKDYYKCQVEDTSNLSTKKTIAMHCDYYPKNNYFFLDKYSLSIFETSDEGEVAPYDSLCNDYINNMRYESPFLNKKKIDINTIKKYITCNLRHSVCVIDLSKLKNDGIEISKLTFIQYKCTYSNRFFYDKGRASLIFFFSLFTTFLYIFYYLYLSLVIEKSEKIHNDNFYQINQYTVHVKNVNIDPKPPRLYQDLNLLVIALHNAAQYHKIEESDLEICDDFNDEPIYESSGAIYQISYSIFDNTYLDVVKDKFELMSTVEIPNYTRKKENVLSSKLTNHIYDLNLRRKEKVEIRERLQAYNTKLSFEKHCCDNVKINDLFVTFKTKGHAEKCYNCYNSKSWLFRFFIEKCLDGKRKLLPFYYKDQWLDVDYIPCQTDGVKYENLRIDDITRKLPKPMSVLIVFILVCGSLVIYYLQVHFQRELDSEFINYINCGLYISKEKTASFISINEVMKDEEEKDLLKRYNTYCYCKYNLDEFGRRTTENVYYERAITSLNDDEISQTVRVFPCRRWFKSIDKSWKMDFLMYFLIIIYDCFSLWVIQLLPKYERYKTKMDERKRLMTLVYFFSIFANGINVVIANANISDFLSNNMGFIPLLTGKYINFNSFWFYNVGTTISILILLNCFIPYLLEYLKFLLMFFIRNVCCKGILNKNNKYYFLYWYIGPEYHLEVKLGIHLSLISIIMLFNFTITNFPSFLFLIFTTFISFYLDKILFTRYCKIPENYNQELNKLYYKIFFVVIIISTITNCYQCCLLMNIIHEVSPLGVQLKSLISNSKFWVYMVIAIILILYPLIRYSLIPFIIFCACKKKNIAYGFADNKAFEKDFVKDFTIYESLPLSILYKNYTIRKLEFSQIEKYALYHDVDKLLEFYRQKLDIDREAIQEKVRILMHDRIDLDENFDEKMKLFMDRYYQDLDDTKIKKDFSYNMSYYDIFEAPYIEKMIDH